MLRGVRLAALAAVVALALAGCGGGVKHGPPAGLTLYGRKVWNLDALLHASFGHRQVTLNFGPKSANYSIHFTSEAQSNDHTDVFVDAEGSQFTLRRPNRPPPTILFGFGEYIPLTVNGAFISCAPGKWLYLRNGQDTPGGEFWCVRPNR